jgi:hypothetical protein
LITPEIVIENIMMILPNIDELKSLFSFKEVSVGDYIYDLQIRSDITEEAEKQVSSLLVTEVEEPVLSRLIRLL